MAGKIILWIILFVLLVVKDLILYNMGFREGINWALDEFDRVIEEEYGNKEENDIH